LDPFSNESRRFIYSNVKVRLVALNPMEGVRDEKEQRRFGRKHEFSRMLQTLSQQTMRCKTTCLFPAK
jgi:hypothetical protein